MYRPLDGLEAWSAVPVDEATWTEAVDTLERLHRGHPGWAAMVTQGALLAAAYQSGAGIAEAKADVGLAMLRGESGMAFVDEAVVPHVHANFAALVLATGTGVSEAGVRRIHEVACRAQLTHEVIVDGRLQDHVLAGGEYKHHPNHRPTEGGGWKATAPVALVESEMAKVVEAVGSPGFAALHPAVRAAYLHHALMHVQPFAAGNGRVARALAGGELLRAGLGPLLVWPQDVGSYLAARTPAETVAVVERAVTGLARALASLPTDGPAVDRWRAQEAAAHAFRAEVAAAVLGALRRHAAAAGRRADLSAAKVIEGEPLVIAVPDAGVDETLSVDTHPLDGGPLSVTAREAALRFEAGQDLDPWLDRVVSVLALRVAAEVE